MILLDASQHFLNCINADQNRQTVLIDIRGNEKSMKKSHNIAYFARVIIIAFRRF